MKYRPPKDDSALLAAWLDEQFKAKVHPSWHIEIISASQVDRTYYVMRSKSLLQGRGATGMTKAYVSDSIIRVNLNRGVFEVEKSRFGDRFTADFGMSSLDFEERYEQLLERAIHPSLRQDVRTPQKLVDLTQDILDPKKLKKLISDILVDEPK
jgi:hypothetical protein